MSSLEVINRSTWSFPKESFHVSWPFYLRKMHRCAYATMRQSYSVSSRHALKYSTRAIDFECIWFRLAATGSLSKGTEDNVRALIDANLVQLLLSIITNPSTDKYLMEICLCVVRSIYEHPFAPGEIINTNAATLIYLIGKTNLWHFDVEITRLSVCW